MTPTMKLRFVQREISVPVRDYTSQDGSSTICEIKKVRVLQQWWEERELIAGVWIGTNGVWKDVPLEEEE